jgi:hypothetical protein
MYGLGDLAGTLWNAIKWMFSAQSLTNSGFCIMHPLESDWEKHFMEIIIFSLSGLSLAWMPCVRPWNYTDFRWYTPQ